MKVRLYDISILLLIATSAGGQNPMVVDSLTSLLENRRGAARYPALYELAFEYIDKDNEL